MMCCSMFASVRLYSGTVMPVESDNVDRLSRQLQHMVTVVKELTIEHAAMDMSNILMSVESIM